MGFESATVLLLPRSPLFQHVKEQVPGDEVHEAFSWQHRAPSPVSPSRLPLLAKQPCQALVLGMDGCTRRQIAKSEGLVVDKDAIEALAQSVGNDVRQARAMYWFGDLRAWIDLLLSKDAHSGYSSAGLYICRHAQHVVE